MKLSAMIVENRQIQKSLNKQNEKYYGDLLLYIRSAHFKKERAKEEVLLEMGQHILEAQQNGQDAHDVFGKNPKQLADDIIANLPNETTKDISLFAVEICSILFGTFWLFYGIIPLFKQQPEPISLGNVASVGGLLIILLVSILRMFFKLVKKEAFQEGNRGKVTIRFGIFYAVGIVLFVIAITALPKFGPTVTLPFYSFFVIGIALLLTSFILQYVRRQ